MADQMPICDVLCEALQYLSKLGSNLQKRSNNLKEKKISKEKLRDTHSVQKAADKILTICKLSKNSIENVECGVKKILMAVDSTRESSDVGAKTSTSDSNKNETEYQYFEHDSQTLKISKNVPVKHYTSLKVIARSMPTSMQDKYPVYYNCKLYRLRKKKALENKLRDAAKNKRHSLDSKPYIQSKNISEVESDDEKNAVSQENKENSDSDSHVKPESKNMSQVESDNEKMYNCQEKKRIQNKNNLDSDSHIESEVENKSNEESDDESNDLSQENDKNKEQTSVSETHVESESKNQSEVENDDKKNDIPQEKRSRQNSSSSVLENEKETETFTLDKSDGMKTTSEPLEIEQSLEKKIEGNGESNFEIEDALKNHSSDEIHITHSQKSHVENFEKCNESNIESNCESNFEIDIGKNSDALKNHSSDEIHITHCQKSHVENLEKCNESKIESNCDTKITESHSQSDNSLLCESHDKEHLSDESHSNKVSKLKENKKRHRNSDSDSELNRHFSKRRKEKEKSGKSKKFRNIRVFSDSSESSNEKSLETTEKSNTENLKDLDIVENANVENEDNVCCNNSNETSFTQNDKNKCDEQQKVDIKDNISSTEKPSITKEGNNISISLEKENLETEGKIIKETDCCAVDQDEHDTDTRESNKSYTNTMNDDEILSKPEDDIQNKLTTKSYESEDSDSQPKKPLIKCVNINKLLKSEVVDSDEKKKNNKNKSIDKKQITQKITSCKLKESSLNIKKDSKYWEEKRKEVSLFKPKKFSINVDKLPQKFSEIFLCSYNIMRITKFGSTIFERREIGSDKSKLKNSADIDKVKNALLTDSDSDESILAENIDKAIDSLLKESDSEEALKKKNSECQKENEKEALLKDSDSNNENIINKPTDESNEIENSLSKQLNSDKSEKEEDHENSSNNNKGNSEMQPSQDEQNLPESQRECHDKTKNSSRELSVNQATDKIKSTLLNDSSDNCPKTPDNKKSEKKDSPPRSKRKHIMESMHAKKMLLTYSSSSDTEDEQLRSALKEIKDSLLMGVSSSDDDKDLKKRVNESYRKKLLTSSDSEVDDMLVKLKSQKNIRRDSSSEKDKKKEGTSSEQEENDKSKKDTGKKKRTMKRNTKSDDEQKSSSKMGRSKTKPGGSSSQNTDAQDSSDKDIDGLVNLKTLNRTHRRKDSTVTDVTEDTNSKKNKTMPKLFPINGENLLEQESNSDGLSDTQNEGDEELPTIMISSDLNGDDMKRLAKDDLLGDSDSSSSQNEKEKSVENIKEEDTSDVESNVKSKRRKANAISSDSEAGSSRKKEQEAKVSDFEDSDDENSEPAKRIKRKKKGSDSDGSAGTSSNEGGKKKRRRIKQVNDSDASGSDTENEGRNKHGRKNIRKVMGKDQLEEATKKAAREEKERIARIAERQKLYNNLEFDESGKPDEVVLEKVVLDFDPETKEPLIEVDRGLVKKLKPHQANGIKFMWDACFESVKRIKKDKGSGCILAHCMGLGKTLQVVSLTHTLLTHGNLTGVKRVLVVCPLSTVLNWVNEFRMWLKHAETEYEVDVYELSRFKQNCERAFQLQQWLDCGGVCVLGYEMFRNLSADNTKKFRKKMLRSFQESLVDPGPDLVVCDEGHLLKNEKTSLSQSMNKVKTRRRIVLTGTPLQNNLKEYYCMVQFVKPNLLGKYNEYLNRFVNPITNGQYTDSTEHDIRVMKRRSHVLHKMLDGAVQRRDYGVLAPFLPPKHEYVLFITLTEVQIKLYQLYLDNFSRRPLPGKSSGFLFPDFQSLQRIWTHPLVLKYNSERYEIMQQKKREREEEDSEGSLADFIDDDSTSEETSTEESSEDLSDLSDDSRKKSKKKKSTKKNKGKESKVSTRRGTRANPVELDEDEKPNSDIEEVKYENPTEWWIKLVSDDELDDMRNSHKLVLLFDILRQCEAIGDKVLVFSQSLYSLDLIEHFLGKVDEATQDGRIDEKLGGHVGSWSPGIDYFRLDGSTSCENRSIWCKNFNKEDNPRARLFLISTRAGGLGINLVAANRVVIFDVSWNPSHDVQSIFRVYRFGQKKPCYIYRFLAMGTMEEKIYERQVTKQAISKRVIDEQQIDRHYAENDLAELYKFEPHPPVPRQLPPLPKDRLFAEMLKEHEAQIYKYHEHDSLLENKEEETLTEEERKAAWEDFENEKNRPPPAPFPSVWPMHNGMAPGLLAQQQQQLAYAALAAMLRKDAPNMNDNQIRDMLPHIYNSNPGLMQKMSEIYKYVQPNVMNPGMMNPVMNPGGGGMGGTSGLQYEPPWQRQHQQQQQMRLQQLIQQQQNMNAKYYAGGLGSRDPVAMALQQQRAREIMMGERSRPRGRPPLQPRAPSAAPLEPLAPAASPPDVVNLADSD